LDFLGEGEEGEEWEEGERGRGSGKAIARVDFIPKIPAPVKGKAMGALILGTLRSLLVAIAIGRLFDYHKSVFLSSANNFPRSTKR